jgi:hypothetical protein
MSWVVDTSVQLDIYSADPTFSRASTQRLAEHCAEGLVVSSVSNPARSRSSPRLLIISETSLQPPLVFDGDAALQEQFDRHPSALAGKLDPRVECLVAKWGAVPTRKDERRSREVHSPAPKPHALDTFQESEPFLVTGRSRKELPLTWRRAAIIIPPGSRTSRSIVSRAHS